jgi:hypothetical protein
MFQIFCAFSVFFPKNSAESALSQAELPLSGCCCLQFGLFLFSPELRTCETLYAPHCGLRQQQLTALANKPTQPNRREWASKKLVGVGLVAAHSKTPPAARGVKYTHLFDTEIVIS